MSSIFGGQGPSGSRGLSSRSGDIIPKGYKKGQLQQFTPEQMQLFQSLFGHVGPDSFLSRLAGGDEAAFGEMEAPALQQFAGLQGNLASRFSGMGAGARHSSGFQNAATSAASDFAQQLQSQRTGLQRQALMDLMGMSESLLGQRPYENFITPKKKSFLQSLLGMGGEALGQFGGSAAGMGGNLSMLKLFGLI